MAKKKQTKGKGRKENKAKKKLRVDVRKLYKESLPDFRLGMQDFRFTAIRKGIGNVIIDPYVESVEWTDEGGQDELNAIPCLRGSISLKKPATGSPGQLTLKDGHVIRCEVNWHGRWTECWRMRIQKPTLGYADGSWGFELADDLLLASLSKGSFHYRKGKKRRKKGWLYHQIVKSICRKYRIPMGTVKKGKHRIEKFSHPNISPLDAIRLAVKEEVDDSGKRLVIVWQYSRTRRRSGINILPLRRNKTLYKLKEHIQGADLTQTRRADLATAYLVSGTKKRGKKRKKFKTKVVAKKAVKQYGYIEKPYNVGTVDSVGAARRKAKRRLKKVTKPTPVIESVTHPGIAFVRRGDAILIEIPEEGYKGKKSLMFVTAITHNLASGDYSMSPTLALVDPHDPNDIRAEREKATRAKKRKKKGKKRS